MFTRVFAWMSIFLLLSACGPTHQQVADEYKSRILAKKQLLVSAAKTLKDEDYEEIPACEGVTAPLRWSYYGSNHNMTIAMQEWLIDPDNSNLELPFNLTSAHDLEETLDWVSPQNPRSIIQDETAEEGFKEKFESVLALEYIVLNRVNAFSEPKLVTSESFIPGSVAVSMVVMQLDPLKILCKADFSAETPEEVVAHSLASFPDMFQGKFALRRALFERARESQKAILRGISEAVE